MVELKDSTFAALANSTRRDILARLAGGEATIGELADAFNLDRSTVNRQTAALLRRNLARRVPDPKGGMARKLQVTEEGARRLNADRELRREGIGALVADWSPDEIERFEAYLRRFNQSIEEGEKRLWPRSEAG